MHLTISRAKLYRGVPKFERAGRVSRARVLIYGFSSAVAVIYFGIQMSVRDSVEAVAAGNARVSTRVQHAYRERSAVPRCDRSLPRYRRKSQKDSREPARDLSRPVTRPVEREQNAERDKRGREREARAKRRGRSSHE